MLNTQGFGDFLHKAKIRDFVESEYFANIKDFVESGDFTEIKDFTWIKDFVKMPCPSISPLIPLINETFNKKRFVESKNNAVAIISEINPCRFAFNKRLAFYLAFYSVNFAFTPFTKSVKIHHSRTSSKPNSDFFDSPKTSGFLCEFLLRILSISNQYFLESLDFSLQILECQRKSNSKDSKSISESSPSESQTSESSLEHFQSVSKSNALDSHFDSKSRILESQTSDFSPLESNFVISSPSNAKVKQSAKIRQRLESTQTSKQKSSKSIKAGKK